MIPDLRPRRREAELMDQPGLGIHEHARALTALGRANRISRTAATIWPAIRRAAHAHRRAPLRVLDVASGGGHVALALADRATRERLALDIIGCDISPAAVDYARTLAARRGVEGVQFKHLDALNEPWPDGIDVAMCSLFLHHLDGEDAVALLGRMKAAARRLVLVSDLRRSSLGYVFAWAGCRLLSRSRIFHVDGSRSVAAAFTPGEARTIAVRAGLDGARVTTHWPQRWLLTWAPDGA